MSSIGRHKSSYQFGKERKDRIVEAIQKGTVMTTNQIQTLFFSNLKPNSAKRKTQEVMRELTIEGRVKRYHRPEQQFVPAYYYIDQKPKNLIHYLLINEVLCEFYRQKPSLFKLDWQWSYPVYDIAVADAFISISYDPDGKKKQSIFLEVERNPKKRFNKDRLYTSIFNKDWHIDLPEWVVVDKKKGIAEFPTVLIVTDDKDIEVKETDVQFIIATPEQVAEDVYKLIWKE